MEKDKTILDLLKRLRSVINFDLLQIVDYWEADLCAIGIKRGKKLIYISTYNYLNKPLRVDYDLEILDNLDESNFKLVKEARQASEDELAIDIKGFLNV
jgi:hypothetical protein